MRYGWPLLLIFLALLLCSSPSFAADGIYSNTQYGFSMVPPIFPHDSSNLIPVSNFIDTPRDGFAANISIQIIKYDKGIDEYRKIMENGSPGVGQTIVDSKNIIVGKWKGIDWQVTSTTSSGKPTMQLIRAVEQGDHILAIIATALQAHWEQYKPIFRKTLLSLDLK